MSYTEKTPHVSSLETNYEVHRDISSLETNYIWGTLWKDTTYLIVRNKVMRHTEMTPHIPSLETSYEVPFVNISNAANQVIMTPSVILLVCFFLQVVEPCADPGMTLLTYLRSHCILLRTMKSMKNNAWVTVNNDFWVTSEAICQWFSRVTKSRVKIIGKSHHEWPKNRYSR